MVMLGAIVAPTTFEVLQASAGSEGRELAGALFGVDAARDFTTWHTAPAR